jgi:CRISPR-associated protein Cas1
MDQDGARIAIARKMYALRLGEILPHGNLNTLRGIEGARMKRTYHNLAQRYGVPWQGRRYDRNNPLAADIPNQAINHASVAVNAAATIAVYALGAIPQLGFIHEHSGEAFILDIADLFRDTVLLPAALKSAKAAIDDPTLNLERHTRKNTGKILQKDQVIPTMIERIKTLFDGHQTSTPEGLGGH